MEKEHHYKLKVNWYGATDAGNENLRTYDRSHSVSLEGKPELHLTTDDGTVGDQSKLNPEELLVSAVASCHMLSFLYLCSRKKIVITSYEDNATGLLIERSKGKSGIEEVVLNPVFTVADDSMKEKAVEMHHTAHDFCYIANSVNFEIKCNPVCL